MLRLVPEERPGPLDPEERLAPQERGSQGNRREDLGELAVGGLQARERPVAQDPAAIDSENDEDLENAPDTPDIGTTPSVAPPSVVTQGR